MILSLNNDRYYNRINIKISIIMLRIQKELKDLINNPPVGITAGPANGDNMLKWNATIVGPSGTPYQDAVFKLSIVIPSNYPFRPPEIKFITPIYHCNINSDGVICLDLLRDSWSPALTIDKVLLSISSLMAEPNPKDPLMPSIANLLEENKAEHDATARRHTLKHANV